MDIAKLHQLFIKSSGVSTDSRKIQVNSIFFALKGEHFNGNTFAQSALEKGASYAVIDQPKYANDKTIIVKDTLAALQELSTFHRKKLGLPIIAITGSNGKTTSKELIREVLSKKYNCVATQGNFNNHIGVPLTLLSMKSDTEVGIVEMGTNHPGEIATLCQIAQPNMGYISLFGKSHLEGLGGVDGVIKEKSELYRYVKRQNGLIFLNKDDKKQVEIVGNHKHFSFSQTDNANLSIKIIKDHPFLEVCFNHTIIQSKLIGKYNFTNIAVAVAIGLYHQVSPTQIKEAIEAYVPNNNRSQIIEKNGCTIILDSYNANPISMEAALQNFEKYKGLKVCFLGDMLELGKYSEKEHQHIADLAATLKIQEIFLVGKAFSSISSTTQKVFKNFETLKKEKTTPFPKGTHILIKGSGGMGMERILDLL